ncbi:MAG: shikimate dehydrogenase family protein [Hydrogenophaga sp.]|uniref:shikimate dehydrogenase family protein n=1 Tax=Hydrogenophaga sp. TaxID=1904254 RepID=UPI00403585CF
MSVNPPPTPAVNGRTAVVPLLAYPSEHVRTPGFFNQHCSEHGINAVMVPWKVSPAGLPAAIEAIRRIENIPGFVITIPHKQEVCRHCDTLEGLAEVMGVCNAVRKNADGTLSGRMHDGQGFVQGLLERGIPLAGRSVLLAGAGGVATAIAFELAGSQVGRIGIRNRSVDKARELGQQLSRHFPDLVVELNPARVEGYDIAVNGTSLGLHPEDPMPFDPTTLRQDTVVAEVVMQPDITPLLQRASENGQRIHKGVHMVTTQIRLLVEFTTGQAG